MTKDKVIRLFEAEYEKANKLKFVRNPVAYALYKVWKLADADTPTEKGGEGGMTCNFCKADLYIKTVQYTKPLLAPLTRAEELRQELQDLTGEVYLKLPNEYCAMCGKKLHTKGSGEKNDRI